MADFRACGVEVVGASTDSPEKNARFKEEVAADYPLLSDVGGTAVRALGIDGGSGRARRTTFLIDSSGIVRRVWEDVRIDGHEADVLAAAKSLAP